MHRVANRRAATELFTESRDEQQRVVHAKAESEQCGEVQHEDAHACCLRNAEDCGERNDHCCATNGEWESCGDRGAKHQQQNDCGERKTDQLAALKIGLRNTLNVCIERRTASNCNLDAWNQLDRRLDPFECRRRIIGLQVKQNHVVDNLLLNVHLRRCNQVRARTNNMRRLQHASNRLSCCNLELRCARSKCLGADRKHKCRWWRAELLFEDCARSCALKRWKVETARLQRTWRLRCKRERTRNQ